MGLSRHNWGIFYSSPLATKRLFCLCLQIPTILFRHLKGKEKKQTLRSQRQQLKEQPVLNSSQHSAHSQTSYGGPGWDGEGNLSETENGKALEKIKTEHSKNAALCFASSGPH